LAATLQMHGIPRLLEFDAPITLSHRGSGLFPYKIETEHNGIKYYSIVSMDDVKRHLPELWQGFCEDNKICPECGKDIDTLHCADGCIDPIAM
jgi:hypothetical protein